MRKQTASRKSLCLASTALAISLVAGTSALAQTAPNTPAATDSTDKQAASASDIVVTGSRIPRPNLQSPVPVLSVAGDQFFQSGSVSIGDQLNQLPALRSTFSQANSTQFLGTSGLNLLDLRGLGTQRTLVLVNGRRHVAGDILNTAASVDVNTIPQDMIERVDIVTGGDSAVYGSDAIAGVVNFVLKDHFSGLQVRGQNGISSEGDAGSSFVSVLGGVNTKDGRGNIAVNVEYAHQADLYASERPHYAQNNGFVQVQNAGAAGAPAYQFVNDIRNGVYSNGGTFLGFPPVATGFYQPYLFQPNGSLAAQTGTLIGNPDVSPYPTYTGGDGNNFRDGQQLALQPRLNRVSANLVGHYEFSDAATVFTELTFSRTTSYGSASGPFFTGALGETFNVTNPYLTPASAAFISSQTGGGPFALYRNVVELGDRTESARRDTFRAVLGLKGNFAGTLHYEISANYGRLNEHTEIDGNVNLQRYLLSINAVSGPNGTPVCAVQLDPTQGSPFNSSAYAQSTYANDVASCVPVNLFGSGNISQAAKNYLLQNSYADGHLTQLDFNGFVSGDLGEKLKLPGGPIGFAIGAEYRKETAFYQQDAATASGTTFYNGIPGFVPGKFFEVGEVYGELRLPVIKDLPLIKRLEINAAGRESQYKGSTGRVGAYNAGVEYSPFNSLLFRGNFSHSVRAPNLSELYSIDGQNYATVNDPCSLSNISSGTQYRKANCAAAGIPANYNYQFNSSLPYLSGGNTTLRAEVANTWTVGGVFRPEFLPGASLTVDYYHIKLASAIDTLGAQQILNDCYDVQVYPNQYCAAFQRSPGTSPTAYQIVPNSLVAGPLNYAKEVWSGIDFELAYQHMIENVGVLSLQVNYTLALRKDEFLDPLNPNNKTNVLGLLGDPKNAFLLNTSLRRGKFTAGYKLRYLGKMFNGSSYQQDPYSYAPQYTYYPAVTYHDIRAEIDVNKKLEVHGGIDNVTNKLPPFGITATGNGAIYPNIGRYFYFGFKVNY